MIEQILVLLLDLSEPTRLNLLLCKFISILFLVPSFLKLMNRYAFDVDPDSQTFLNRRIFAYIDAGIPDGIQIDKNGNVYAGCGDGIQVSLSFSSLFDPTFINYPLSFHRSFFTGLLNLLFFFLYLLRYQTSNRHFMNLLTNRYGTLKAPS